MYSIYLIRSFSPYATTPIYTPGTQDTLPLVSGRFTLEINEGGSLEFTLPFGHPFFDTLEPMSTFVTVRDDTEEVFYGRIFDRSDPTLTGRITYQGEGALSFLQDSEIPPESKNSKGEYNKRTMTAEAFFRWCIEQHNADVNDPRRQFTVGQVTATRKNESDEYQITSYTETKSAISQYILDRFGGMLRVRAGSNGVHYIDWVQDYGVTDPQPVEIGSNVTDMTTALSGEGFFTVLRPVGANGLTLSPATIDIYPSDKMAKYGRIIKSEIFNDADTAEKLRQKANLYISRMEKRLSAECQVSLVDFHFLNGSIPKIRLGHMFSNIRGLEGETMTITGVDQDILKVSNGQYTMKNSKELGTVLDGRVRGGTMSKAGARGAGIGSMALKYYHELEDEAAIEVAKLRVSVEELDVNVSGVATVAADAYALATNNYESISHVENTVEEIRDVDIAGLNTRVRTIEGAAVIQNSDHISNVAGNFEVWEDQTTHKKTVHLKNGAEIAVDKVNGGTITVGELTADVGRHEENINSQRQIIEDMTGSALWTQRDQITGVSGQFEVVEIPDPDNPGDFIKKLRIVSGGGMVVARNGAEYGVYDNGNLTGGLIVSKLSDGTVTTQISGDIINIATNDDFSTLVVSHNGLVNRVGAAESGISTLENTAAGFRTRIEKVVDASGKIKAAEIATSINNQTGESKVKLSADVIEMDGDTIASRLAGSSIEVQDFELYSGGDFYLGEDTTVTIGDGTVIQGQAGVYQLRNMIISASVNQQTNTLTLQPLYGSAINFKKAASSLSGAWSGSTLTVTPTGESTPRYTVGFTGDPNELLGIKYKGVEVGSTAGTVTVSGAVTSDYYDDEADIWAHGTERHAFNMNVNLSGLLESRAATINTYGKSIATGTYTPTAGKIGINSFEITVNPEPSWNAGYDTAEGYFSPPETKTASNVSNSFAVGYPKSDRSGQGTYTYTMTKGTPGTSGYASVMLGNDLKARIDISDWYEGGWKAAAGKVITPTTQPSNITNTLVITYPNKTTPDGADGTIPYTVTVDDDYAYIKAPGGVTVARVENLTDETGWNAGYDTAYGYFAPPETKTAQNVSNSFTIGYPKEDRSGQGTYTYALTKGTPGTSGYASVMLGNDLKARIDISDWYIAGQNSVSVNKSVWSGGIATFSPSAGTGAGQEVRLVNGSPTWSGNVATVEIWDGQSADAQHGSNTGKTVTVDASDMLETRATTINTVGKSVATGTYTPTAGKIGISSFEITVNPEPSWNAGYDTAEGYFSPPETKTASNVSNSFTVGYPKSDRSGQGTYTYTMTKGTPGTSGYASVVLGSNLIARIDIGDWYTAGLSVGVTAGQNGVTINKGAWSNGQVQFTKSAGTADTKGVRVGLSGSWSGNTYNYSIKDYYDNPSGVDTGYSGSIDATARYNAGYDAGNSAGYSSGYSAGNSAGITTGQNGVAINKGAWSGGQISFTKSAGTASTKSVQLVNGSASWSGNTATVQIWDGTSADAQHGSYTGKSVTVDASGRYNAGYSDGVAAATVSDISVEYTGYSNNTNRYTITSGVGVNANLSMQVNLTAGSYSEVNTWNAPVTNAYRNALNDIHHITLDSALNHVGNYYNCVLYNSAGNVMRTMITDQSSTGLIFPLNSPTFTANGTYYPRDYSAGAFDVVTVSVPGSSYSYSATLKQVYDADITDDGSTTKFHGVLYGKNGSSYVKIVSSNYYWYYSSKNIGNNKTVYYN